ncbi:MAG: invasion associated locus B family protein [Hyphomicrobiaceae bacterium]
MLLRLAALTLSLTALALPASAQTAELLQKHRDWSAYRHKAEKDTTCFAVTQPKDSEPKNVNRGDIFLYVSFWPADKVKEQVMLRLGYPIKDNSAVSAAVGSDTFSFEPKDDKAFIQDGDVERKFVEAIKKGDKLVIKGMSKKGTETTDVYSLLGVSAALKQAEEACASGA